MSEVLLWPLHAQMHIPTCMYLLIRMHAHARVHTHTHNLKVRPFYWSFLMEWEALLHSLSLLLPLLKYAGVLTFYYCNKDHDQKQLGDKMVYSNFSL